MIDQRNLRSIHPSHESDRLLAELRTVLRAELMQEFRIGPAPMRRWALLPANEVTELPSVSSLELVRLRYRAQAQLPARIVRLCIEQEHARHWTVEHMSLGCEPLTLAAGELSATAFPPVPKWLVEGSPDELMRSLARVGEGREDLAETVRALLEAFPVQNVPPMTAQPGLELGLTMRAAAASTRPGVWFLCELPSDAPGGVPFGFRAPWA